MTIGVAYRACGGHDSVVKIVSEGSYSHSTFACLDLGIIVKGTQLNGSTKLYGWWQWQQSHRHWFKRTKCYSDCDNLSVARVGTKGPKAKQHLINLTRQHFMWPIPFSFYPLRSSTIVIVLVLSFLSTPSWDTKVWIYWFSTGRFSAFSIQCCSL